MTPLRTAARAALAIGAIGSVALTVYAGRTTPQRWMVWAFAVWVLSPFVALALADAASRRWAALTRAAVYAVMPVVAAASLLAYIDRVLHPPRAQPAFVFVIVPPASWLLIALVVSTAALIARRSRPVVMGTRDQGEAGPRVPPETR